MKKVREIEREREREHFKSRCDNICKGPIKGEMMPMQRTKKKMQKQDH